MDYKESLMEQDTTTRHLNVRLRNLN
jgi:hypothetical protein